MIFDGHILDFCEESYAGGRLRSNVPCDSIDELQEEQKERNKEMTKKIVTKIAEAIIALIFK